MYQLDARKKIGLLGCGAIGTEIALAIDSGRIDAELTHVYDKDAGRARALASRLNRKPEIAENSHLLSSNDVDLIVEAASQDAVREAALGILQNGKDVMIMSVGALLDESILEVLTDACRQFNSTIYLPSGAIAGLDGLNAARSEIDSVEITTIKHPISLTGAKFFEGSSIKPEEISEPTTLFDGAASDAVKLFPANVNVAALVSLAGVGDGATRVRVVADPSATSNTHQISAKGRFGEMSFIIRNVPDPANPRTSRLAVLSAIQRLQTICSGCIRMGA